MLEAINLDHEGICPKRLDEKVNASHAALLHAGSAGEGIEGSLGNDRPDDGRIQVIGCPLGQEYLLFFR
ncbi:MAG: hypothetical protein WCN85_15990, partial [Burkholderiales bacterium]